MNAVLKWDRERILRAALPILVAVVTAAVFLPVVRNGFVNWDDDATLTENLSFRQAGVRALGWMFTTFYLGHYQPLSWLSFAVDYRIWGLNSAGYHLTSMLLHAANAGLFYLVCVRLLMLAKPAWDERTIQIGAALAALFFALHPLRVESVAWATERRDVLSGLFFFLTILAYLKAAASPAANVYRKWLGAALMAYVLSLLSKATAMTLPVALLAMDFFPLRRLDSNGVGPRRVWLEKLPFLILGGAAAVVAGLAQQDTGAMDTFAKHSALQRLAQASFAVCYYVEKTFFPGGIYPMYDLPMRFNPWEPVYVASFFAAAGVTLVLVLTRRRFPAALAAWVYYLALVAPISGIAQSGSQIVADRYTYLSCLGWALLAAGGAAALWRARLRKEAFGRYLAAGAALAVIVALLYTTRRQIPVWRDSATLYEYVLANTPRPSRIAYNNYAGLLADRRQYDQAIAYYSRALEIDPDYDDARSNLGNVLNEQGKTDQAMAQYREALRRRPNSLVAHHNLGLALTREGKTDEAIEHYRKALEINSGFLEGQNNLGLLLAARGQYQEAVLHLRKAIEISPEFPLAHVNLGDVLMALGHRSEAIAEFRKALEIDPNLASARASLEKALAAAPNP
ncbi:MAG TPA: tetratricopeptide repeat protein [Candidatus Binatia bacterium]